MSKVDTSVLDKYSEADAVEFDKEIGAFLDGSLTKTAPSKEAVAYFYLTLHKLENEPVTAEQRGHYAWLYYQDIGHLEGKLLTIIDAVIGEQKQNKATKDLIRRAIWFDWVENLDKVDKTMPAGMPDIQ